MAFKINHYMTLARMLTPGKILFVYFSFSKHADLPKVIFAWRETVFVILDKRGIVTVV